MDGRRFGTGLVAGLLCALAVVGVAMWTSPAGTPGSPSNAATAAQGLQTSTTTETRASETSVMTQPSAGSSGNQTSPNPGYASVSGSIANPGFSSKFSSLGKLSASSKGLLVVPVVAALILGTLAYRISRSNREGSGKERAEGAK